MIGHGGDGAVLDTRGHDLDALELQRHRGLIRGQDGGDVDVVDLASEHGVAHAAADEAGAACPPLGLEGLDHRPGLGRGHPGLKLELVGHPGTMAIWLRRRNRRQGIGP